MESRSIQELKEQLSARSETRSIDELQSRGRKRVKVIRAEQIAAMIAEAVERTIRDSELVSKEDAEQLVTRTRAEFSTVLAERQKEVNSSREVVQELEETKHELDSAKAYIVRLRKGMEAIQESWGIEVTEDEGQARSGSSAGGGSGDATLDIMMKLMTEVATMKARMGAAPAAGGGMAVGDAGVADVLEKLTASMNERLDQFGKKLGVSSAVEADDIKFDALFKDMEDADMESNIDDMEVKQKTGSGIAANLARLKKLKGGE